MASRDGREPSGRGLLDERARSGAVLDERGRGSTRAGRGLLDERGRGGAPAGGGLLDERGRGSAHAGRGLLDERVGDRDRGWGDERGAGTALALAIATAALLLAMLIVGAGTAAIAQARAASAADAAALAAADALSGFADGSPCGLAQAVATASGAQLGQCRIDGLDVTVTATIPVGPLRASVTARAGPPR